MTAITNMPHPKFGNSVLGRKVFEKKSKEITSGVLRKFLYIGSFTQQCKLTGTENREYFESPHIILVAMLSTSYLPI